MKENDWIIANINNPGFTASDFKNIGGLSLENTLLLPIDSYLKSDKITNNDLFKNESGLFSKDKFKTFYDLLAESFNNFAQDSMLDNYEYSYWDVFKKPESRVHNPEFDISKTSNPTHQSFGVIGINTLGERTKSDLELAEKLKIYDWETGKFKDETPEDNSLFKNPFKYIGQVFSSITDPLVLAQYEEETDEIDPLTGEMVHHKKGENKTNSEGEYYFETLGGRSINGKQVLSLGDIITKEDTAVNKFDFFDSDDIEKSPEGVIAKNLISVAPLAFLGTTGTSIYAGFYVARELLKSLPMLYNIGTALGDSDTPSMLNNLAGFGQSLTGNTSEHGKSTTFSFENFGNLIGDVALLWGLLKFIANSLVKIKNSNKTMLDVAKANAISEYEKQAANIINQANKGILNPLQAERFTGVKSIPEILEIIKTDLWANTLVGSKAIEKYMPSIEKAWSNKQKLGQDLSLVYMSMISNTDVYEGALEHGATKTEAAALSLGSMAGMFYVDKYLGLGEMFFDDEEAAARRMYRLSLKESLEKDVKPVLQRLGGVPEVERESRNRLINLFNEGKNFATKFIQDYKYDIKDRSLSIIGKSIGEGLEEVAEEVNTDLWRSLYLLAGLFGLVSQKDIGAWENMEERYLMSLLGGTAGGALFAGVEAIKNPSSVADKNSQKELIHLVKEGRTSDIISELDRMRDRGMLGNKELSIKTTGSESGNYFLSADSENMSLNDFVYINMKSAILDMDRIINGNQLGLTDDLLFERMLLSDIKLMHVKDFLKDTTYMSGYFNEYEKIVQAVYNNETKIQNLESETDTDKRNSEEYKKEYEKLIAERERLNLLKEEFFTSKSQRYLRKTLFGTNANISGTLLPMTYNLYVQLKFGKEELDLAENLKKEAKLLYEKYIKNRKLKDFDEAFEAWDEMTRKINPTLSEIDGEELDVWQKAREEFQKYIPSFQPGNYDDRVNPLKLDTEIELQKIGIRKTEEYDKPWRNDPSKTNKAFDLLLEENPNMYFQVVKDIEDKYWSIHFKTDNPDTSPGAPYSGLTEDLKIRLFKAAALVIPEGEYLSTWGELTPGGISGINRFGLLSFTGGLRFIKSGDRKVKRKKAKIKNVGSFWENETEDSIEVGDGTNYLKAVLTRPGTSPNTFNKEELSSITSPSGKKITHKFYTEQGSEYIISEDGMTRRIKSPHVNTGGDDAGLHDWNKSVFFSKGKVGEDFNISARLLKEKGKTISIEIDPDKNTARILILENGEWIAAKWSDAYSNAVSSGIMKDGEIVTEGSTIPEIGFHILEFNNDDNNVSHSVHPGSQVSFIENTETFDDEDIEIPIWQKMTGETDEEYENRNKAMDGESEEDFAKRKQLRTKRITQQKFDEELELLLKLLESNATIDSNTFRYIVAKIRLRAKDIKTSELKTFGRSLSSYVRIQEVLENLSDDFSNKDEIWDLLESLISELQLLEFESRMNGNGIYAAKIVPEGLNKDKDGNIGFLDIFNFLDSKLPDMMWDDAEDLMIASPEAAQFVYNFSADSVLKNDIRDFFNILRYLSGIKYYDQTDTELEGIILLGNYSLQLDSGEEIEVKGSVSNKEYLMLISQSIISKYLDKEGNDIKVAYDESKSKEVVDTVLSKYKLLYEAKIKGVQNNKLYLILTKLPLKISNINRPTLKLLKSMADKIGVEFSGIEETLKSIYEQFNSLPEASDFRLSDQLIEALENAKNIIELAKAAIIAASGTDSYATPWNYNKTINEWNEAHKDEIAVDIEKLPELSENSANILLLDLYQYQIEINTWIDRARENGINKQKMFREFDTKFEEVKLKFVMENRHKFILDDGTDLLEGFSEKENAKESVLEFERVFYKNTQEALKKGKTVKDLFNAIKGSINWNKAKELKTSRLSVNLEELTDYDKFIYLISSMAYNPDNFYVDYKKFIENNKTTIAPLSFQKYAIRIIKAQQNNLEFMNEMLHLFKDESKFDGDVLENACIIEGIGGAGKTSVVIKGIQSNSVVISGPTETQISNLEKHISDSKSYTSEELLKLALGDLYAKFNDELKTQKNGDLLKFSNHPSGKKVDISAIKIETIENPPKQIIIDEATLFSNALLLVISKFCKLNGILFVLAGDGNQNGDMSAGWNMSREFSLAIRVPKLSMSLRESNLWKFLNLDTLLNLEDSLRDTDSGEETANVSTRLLESDLKKYKLKYYFKEGLFYGDMIIDSNITDQQINSIKFNGDNNKPNVCFVGSTSSEIYKKLKNQGKAFDVKTLEEVLGHEYDYVICDINWKSMIGENPDPKDYIKVLQFMQSLYTIITRSKEGTMIANNGLTDIIGGNAPQTYNSPTVNLNKEAIEQFSKYELDWINKHTWNPTEKEEVKKVTTPINPIKKEKVISVPEEETPIIAPVTIEEENDEEVKKDDNINIPHSRNLPVHVYTNFNYLGINRRVEDDGSVWYNESNSHSDIGIFLRPGEELKENSDKLLYVNRLLDLKSAIIFYNEYATYSSDIFNIVPRKNLKDAKFFITKESYDLQKHHLITEEQDLKELEEGKVIYTLLCRFKDKDDNECSLTLGILPDPEKIRRDIYKSQIERELENLEDNDENKDLREWYKLLLKDEKVFNKLFDDYASELQKIDKEIEINKPDFLLMTGLRKLDFHIRLEEVNSLKSRYDVRNSAYVISPIYTAVSSNEELKREFGREFKSSGKPFILVSADRSYRPDLLIDIYQEQLRNPDNPIKVRQIMLDSMGVSFESLFDYNYKDNFTTITSSEKEYTFPFDLLPVGLRMYVALHNFRANLTLLKDKMLTKFGKDLSRLTVLLKEESRLYNAYKDSNPNGSTTGFRTWLRNNPKEINSTEENPIELKDIESIWEFNDVDLKDVKLFRLGYDTRESPNGVYVREISDKYNGNYINPEIAILWSGTINKIFDVVLDKLIPPESLNGIGNITLITDYKALQTLEETWVSKLLKNKEIKFKLDGEEGVEISISNENFIRAIPVVLTLITKNLQKRVRSNPDQRFKDYDTNPESSYAVTYIDDKGNTNFISYLEILKGGLGEIGHKTDEGLGIHKKGSIYYDYRLIDMFNVLFHGAVSLWSSKENRNDFLNDRKAHAKDVLFPYGFFVDPILGGLYAEGKHFRIVNTNRKYYATNVVPSGTKTFINFDPVKKSNEEVKESKEDINKKELNELSDSIKSQLGIKKSSILTNEPFSTKEELIKIIRKKINRDLVSYFGNSTSIKSLKELINIPIDIDNDGKIVRIEDKIRNEGIKINLEEDLKVIKTGEKSFEIESDGNKFKFSMSTNESNKNIITISNNNGTKTIDPETGKILVTYQGFIDYLETQGYIDSVNKSIYNELEGAAEYDYSDEGKEIREGFRTSLLYNSNIKKILEDNGINEKQLIGELIDTYLNSCEL